MSSEFPTPFVVEHCPGSDQPTVEWYPVLGSDDKSWYSGDRRKTEAEVKQMIDDKVGSFEGKLNHQHAVTAKERFDKRVSWSCPACTVAVRGQNRSHL